MEFRLLGPLEAWRGKQRVDLGGAKQRAVLAMLLLGANEPVSTDALIDGVWGETPPASAADGLEELRLAALEDRIEAELALGKHAELPAELEALALEHPFRERLRAQLMVALYRSGRQAEALDVYRDARRTFVEELGIEPSPALQQLEQAILRQDPGLEP